MDGGAKHPDDDDEDDDHRHSDAPHVQTPIASDTTANDLIANLTVVMSAKNEEQTYIMLKPDGVQRGLLPEVIARFSRKGFKLVGLKLMNVSEEHAKKHYADLSSKPFFGSLVTYMCSGPVVAMVWEGLNVVKTGRALIGETNPAASAPGTLRGDFSIEIGRNIIHGSDAVESAKHEIGLWFPEGVCAWESCAKAWIYE